MNFNNLGVWEYVAIIGAAGVVLAVLLYAFGGRKVRVPAILISGVGGAAVGLGVGVVWLVGLGYKHEPPQNPDSRPGVGGGPPGGGAPGGGQPGGGGPPGGGRGGGAGASPRVQLTNLVTALDTLVDHPVAVTLSAADRAAIAAQLEGLGTAEQITDDEAKARLDAILKVVEKDRQALETVGYRWPGPPAKSGGPPSPPPNAIRDSPNPFRAPQTVERLKSLQERLGKK